MKPKFIFAKGIAAVCVLGWMTAAPSLRAEESLGEKVSDAAQDAWDATKRTAKKVEHSVEKKVDELRKDTDKENDAVHQGNKVNVTLEETQIAMPSAIPAGPTTFVITNKGKERHGFEIEGRKLDRELKKTLQPGETVLLSVDLPPGKYEVECPVGDHDDKGMKRQLTVK